MESGLSVVIGAGGVGAAVAHKLCEHGPVIVADYVIDHARAVAEQLNHRGGQATALTVDVASRDSLRALATHARNVGPVVRLAHTAGVSPAQAGVEAILDIDLVGTACLLEELGPEVAAGGSAVVVASMAGHLFAPHITSQDAALMMTTAAEELPALPVFRAVTDPQTAYGFAKRANQLRVISSAPAWAARGTRINSVSPGVIDTPMGRAEMEGNDGAFIRKILKSSGLSRPATADEVADAVCFLLSPNAAYITGTDLLIDGGAVAAFNAPPTPEA